MMPFGDVFLCKIGRKDEFGQDRQVFLETGGAGKVVRRHIMAGECIWRRAGCSKFLQRIAVFVLEHFMFQEMCNTRRRIDMRAVLHGKVGIDRTEIGCQHGKGLGKCGLGNIIDAQTV